MPEAMEKNQTAKHRIIGLTIETRPDLVTHEHCQQRRYLGVTRIEMGVQSTDDEILRLNKRGHTIQDVREAIHLMRQYGFKISLHLMPGLYGSNIKKDLQTFREVFSDPYLKPDELKIYPTSVIPNTELHRLYQTGEYQPITTEEILQEIRILFQEIIPPYTRIKRLIRDIPAPEIAAGSSITNLSQLAHEMLLREYATPFRKGRAK
ncbi:MAG: radical SAM protein [Candidatus Peribacteria bacterium]|nr:radical SAM protein [Candidatus Peribacteria bacterium]